MKCSLTRSRRWSIQSRLFNPNAVPVNVSGWFLSDDPSIPKKFTIPAGTIIPAGGYVVFDESHFNPTPGVPPSFSLGADGDELYLLSGDGVNLTGYSHGVEFGAGAAGRVVRALRE